MWKNPVNNKIVVGAIGSVLLMSAIFMYGSFRFYQFYSEKQEQQTASRTNGQRTPDYFKDIAIQAQSAYVIDLNTGKVLYKKNETVPLPLASITKTMTALVAEEHGHHGEKITISQAALETDGESGLRQGEVWNLEKLLSFMLVSSSNDSAAAVAQAFPPFIDMMNTKAGELGLESMSFKNATGLDIDEANDTGGYGSAEDVAKLFEYSVKKHPELFDSTRYASQQFYSNIASHKAENTNDALKRVPNSIASKTGFTTKAGGNLAMIFDRGLNEPVILVVLGSTYDGRFSDIELLASSTLKTYNQSQ